MDAVTFLIVYIAFIFVAIGLEVYILSNSKDKYLNLSYKSIKAICDGLFVEGATPHKRDLAEALDRFYNEYIQEMPQLKRLYENVVVWLDAVIFRIDLENKRAAVLKPYIQLLKQVRDVLADEHPYNKCEKYQQSILHDIEKIKTDDNKIIVENIIGRTQDEFLRLSSDIKKNNRLNIVSIAIGVLGIVVSIMMTFIKI